MIFLIGTENCSRCNMTKGLLNNKGIEYEYKLFSELNSEEKDNYMNMAKNANINSFPLIIKDGNIISLQEV